MNVRQIVGLIVHFINTFVTKKHLTKFVGHHKSGFEEPIIKSEVIFQQAWLHWYYMNLISIVNNVWTYNKTYKKPRKTNINRLKKNNHCLQIIFSVKIIICLFLKFSFTFDVNVEVIVSTFLAFSGRILKLVLKIRIFSKSTFLLLILGGLNPEFKWSTDLVSFCLNTL